MMGSDSLFPVWHAYVVWIYIRYDIQFSFCLTNCFLLSGLHLTISSVFGCDWLDRICVERSMML